MRSERLSEESERVTPNWSEVRPGMERMIAARPLSPKAAPAAMAARGRDLSTIAQTEPAAGSPIASSGPIRAPHTYDRDSKRNQRSRDVGRRPAPYIAAALIALGVSVIRVESPDGA